MTRVPRAFWVLLSNGVTGVTNIGIALSLQASGGALWLGGWAICTSPLLVAMAMQRSILSQTVLRGSDIKGVRHLPLCLIAISGISSLASASSVFLFDLEGIFFLASLAIPIFLLQDLYRYRSFGAGKAASSAITDIAWLVCSASIAIVGVQVLALEFNPHLVIFSYVLGSCFSFALCCLSWPTRRSVSGAMAQPIALLIESGAVFGLATLGQVIVSALLSVAVAGEYRLAVSVAQPVFFVAGFTMNYFAPKLDVESRRQSNRLALSAFAICGCTGMICVGVLLVAPSAILSLIKVSDSGALARVAAIVALGQAVSAGISVWLLRIRASTTPRNWLPVRLLGASSDPLVAIPLGIALGPTGLACGPLMNNLVVFALLTRRERSLVRSKGVVPCTTR